MSQPEVITVNSEALEATIRDLLPSQRGFGSELQASNLITPIIDLTPTAEGSALSTDLARAINYGGATAFYISNGDTTPASGLGFYRLTGIANVRSTSSGGGACKIILNDGSTDKVVYNIDLGTVTNDGSYGVPIYLILFLRSQDSLIVSTTSTKAIFTGSVRQIADGNGSTITPTGFEVE